MAWRPRFGENTPFRGEERETVEAIVDALQAARTPKSEQVLYTIAAHHQRLEQFGELLAGFPSPLTRHRLGDREQSLPSLARGLCRSTPANFEFRAPTRAIVGRALEMAEVNFYRLLRYACEEVLIAEPAHELRERATDCLRKVIYTKLAEEVLVDIVSDPAITQCIRQRAVHFLVQIWERRLSYCTREVFPLLDVTWDARQRVKVVGGSFMGAQELFALMREGCDPEFIDYFVRPDPTDDEVASFREFLFGTTAEQLEDLTSRPENARCELPSLLDPNEVSSIVGDASDLSGAPNGGTPLDGTPLEGAPYEDEAAELLRRPVRAQDPGTTLYEFFRSRFLLSTARRMAGLPGPKRTAEGYVLLDFLARSVEGPAPQTDDAPVETLRPPPSGEAARETLKPA
jgi:hypothetical protein